MKILSDTSVMVVRRVIPMRHERTETYLGRKRGFPFLKEEVLRDEEGLVVKYSLALIDPMLFAGDNGRVLGYDNSHGKHHHHYLGNETGFAFTTYTALVRRFRKEEEKLLDRGTP